MGVDVKQLVCLWCGVTRGVNFCWNGARLSQRQRFNHNFVCCEEIVGQFSPPLNSTVHKFQINWVWLQILLIVAIASLAIAHLCSCQCAQLRDTMEVRWSTLVICKMTYVLQLAGHGAH